MLFKLQVKATVYITNYTALTVSYCLLNLLNNSACSGPVHGSELFVARSQSI